MLFSRTSTTQSNGILLTQISSILGGLLILKLGYMSPRWMISGLCGFLLLVCTLLVRDVRRFFLFLFTLSLPVAAFNYLGALDHYHYGGASGLFHTLYDCFLLILYAFWIPWAMLGGGQKINLSGMDACFWLMFTMGAVSMYNAAFIQFSIYELVRLFVMYLIFFYLAHNLSSEKDFKLIVTALFIGLFLESILGMIQYSFGEILGLGLLGEKSRMMEFYTLSRVGGTLGHPNAFARYLGFLIPLTISLQFSSIRPAAKLVCSLLFVLATCNLIMTFSRASWIGLAISLMSIFIISLIGRLISFKKAFLISLAGLIALTGVTLIYKDAILTRLMMDDSGSMSSRIPQMEIAFNIIETHPLLGIGLNNYSEVMHLFDDTPERITSYFLNTVHNVYLLIASEIGIPGLIFFLSFIVLLFKKGFEILAEGHDFYSPLTMGMLAGLISFLIQILVMPPTLTSTSFIFFWVFSGLILAAWKTLKQDRLAEGREA